MAATYDCSDSAQLLTGTREMRQAIGRGELVVLPTDTVYGVAADAFTPKAVQRLLDAKGRGRQSPPPVLIPGTATLTALAAEVPQTVTALAEAFWPGPLTLVLKLNPSLSIDLGETGGTVALRIPNHPLALELLQETGPLAVSSANSTGDPAATTAAQAQGMLGDAVAVYLEAGAVSGDGTASTILDATLLTDEGGTLRVLREGGVSREAIVEVLPEVTILDRDEASAEPSAAGGHTDEETAGHPATEISLDGTADESAAGSADGPADNPADGSDEDPAETDDATAAEHSGATPPKTANPSGAANGG